MQRSDRPFRRHPKGITILEIVLAIALMTSVSLVAAGLFKQTTAYFRRMSVRNQMTTDLTTCMQTITQFLQLGRASSVVISTPNTTPRIPNSRIDFQLVSNLANGTSAYAFLFTNNMVQMQTFVTSNSPRSTRLASNVQSLIFGYPDTGDPNHIVVTLRLSGNADPRTPINLSLNNQVVTLLAN